MEKVELLAPAGDFNCLVSAVQNGANAVYFGADKFNARINGQNFSKDELSKAIKYAKLRNVKTYLTLNIVIKDEEISEVLELVNFVYAKGIDAIIVQDLGIAKKIIEEFPDLPVHASTQMTIYNVEGIKQLKKLGIKRAVLARELSIDEISEICKNSDMDIEVFVHGALCISYSGQCLMSSIIGNRSGNRGECAGTCRLPYELKNKENEKTIEKGYLLSSKDVCSLEILPELLSSGVKSFKIEGRMKSPEYVGIVTSIYRKYIDLALLGNKYFVEPDDKEKLLQIFNRGGFSTGYLKGKLGKNMMYTEKPNHMGICVGEVDTYKENRGYITLKLEKEINLGDSICIDNYSCKISELMKNNQNIKNAQPGEVVTIGRIKGRIFRGNKVYKTVSLKLINEINQKNIKENIKRIVDCKVVLKENEKLKIEIIDIDTNINVEILGMTVEKAQSAGITEERVAKQLYKTGDTIFEIKNLKIEMDENVWCSAKDLNELRRNALEELEQKLEQSIDRNGKNINFEVEKKSKNICKNVEVSVLLNKLDINNDYNNIKGVDKIYILVSEIFNNKVEEIAKSNNVYIYFPAILKKQYMKQIQNRIEQLVEKGIKGFVISNISQIEYVQKYNLEIIANYTFNIFNNYTIKQLKQLGIDKYTISPESSKKEINSFIGNKELIVYGRTLLMTSEYCPIGTFKDCEHLCVKNDYVLKDRLNFEFPIYTDKINCNSKIYNSKITSIDWSDLDIESIRIDIIDENVENINNIIEVYKGNKRLEGKEYTNGKCN